MSQRFIRWYLCGIYLIGFPALAHCQAIRSELLATWGPGWEPASLRARQAWTLHMAGGRPCQEPYEQCSHAYPLTAADGWTHWPLTIASHTHCPTPKRQLSSPTMSTPALLTSAVYESRSSGSHIESRSVRITTIHSYPHVNTDSEFRWVLPLQSPRMVIKAPWSSPTHTTLLASDGRLQNIIQISWPLQQCLILIWVLSSWCS